MVLASALSKWYLCGSEGNFDSNEHLAWTFAEKAASRQLPSAEFALGYFCEVGIARAADLDQARRWYQRVSILHCLLQELPLTFQTALRLLLTVTAMPSNDLTLWAWVMPTRCLGPITRLKWTPSSCAKERKQKCARTSNACVSSSTRNNSSSSSSNSISNISRSISSSNSRSKVLDMVATAKVRTVALQCPRKAPPSVDAIH